MASPDSPAASHDGKLNPLDKQASDLEHQATVLEASEGRPAKGWRSWYQSPLFQVFLVSFTCFCCPGMFNALSGLGGGGKQDATTADNGNVALYSTFAVFGFFGGSIMNRIGARLTLSIGALGYSLYIGALWSTVISQTKARENFTIAAGAILGVCAGMLWTAQGAFMLAYSTEKSKGRYIAFFWAIFNLGAVVGAAIPLGQNFNANVGGNTPGSTYLAFLIITLVGACLPFLLVDPAKMVRDDGTRVVVPTQRTVKTEVLGLWFALRTDTMVLLLFPFFLASNWFYTYQFNAFNGGGLFTYRARTLNNLLYWSSQILGSGLIGLFLDSAMSRRLRAWGGWILVFTIVMAVHGGDYAVQKTYTRATLADPSFVPIDVYDSGYAGKIILYIFNGLMDAMWQSYAYWLMGALSNDMRKLAYYSGFYKGIQSVGAAIIFRVDAKKAPFMNILASSWALCGAGLLIMLPMLYLRIQDHTVEEVVDEAGDVVPEKST